MATALDRAPSDAPIRQRTPARSRSRRLRSWRTAVAAFAVLAAAGAAVGVGVGRSTSPALAAFSVPTSYHVTYAVTAPNVATSTEQLWVRRPFDSVYISYSGPPSGTKPSLVLVYRLGVQVLKAGDAEAGQLKVPAGIAPQDVRADVVVPAAIAAHRLELVGRQHVLGRACQVFRSAAPLRSGTLPTLKSGSTYVDTCIDASGIVLRETQVTKGHPASDRRAVQVETGDPAVADAPFDMSARVTPFDSGGGAFTPLTATSRPPGQSWALTNPPAGFEHRGRYAVVPPQPQLFAAGAGGTGGSAPQAGLITGMDDVFVRGVDAIVLQQGSAINGAAFSPPGNSVAVDLGPLGRGQLLVAGNVTTVVAEPGNGKRFVRLAATLPPEQVVALMRSLATQPGGTLTRLSGRPS